MIFKTEQTLNELYHKRIYKTKTILEKNDFNNLTNNIRLVILMILNNFLDLENF